MEPLEVPPLCCPCDLGPAPKLVTREHVARALEALHWCNGQADTIEGAMNQAVAAAKADAARKGRLQVEATETSVDAYAALLEAEIERWGLENPAEFEKEKTLHFDFGSLGHRTGPTAVAPIGDQKTLTEKVLQSLKQGLDALLKKAGLLGYWRVKLEPELREMGTALKAGTLKPADLKRHGFKVVPGKERIEITVGVTTSAKQ